MFFFILHFFCIFMQFNQSEHFFVMNSIKSASTIEWICYKIAPANNHFEYFCIASEMKTNNCQDRHIILWFPFPRKKTMVIFVVYITCCKTLFNLHCIELRRLKVHFLSGWTCAIKAGILNIHCLFIHEKRSNGSTADMGKGFQAWSYIYVKG